MTQRQKTVVVGAGPVGSLAALYAAARGDEVHVYELRGDLRDASTVPLNFTKSINLALSERGISAIRNAKREGLLERILSDTIPMYGRMIHTESNGRFEEHSQWYDPHGRFIRAADRAGLSKEFLNELEKMPNVHLHFHHKLMGADFKRNIAWFQPSHAKGDSSHKHDSEIEVSFDFMIGADGAHSSVRYHLMKFVQMTYQQEYIDTLWCEFQIAPSAAGDFQINPNRLHIWPGREFMFIAIPSQDKSFTCTLFMPAEHYDTLDNDSTTLVPFFQKNFPGVVPNLISPEDLHAQYNRSPHLPLITVKTTPYHYGASVIILGDAAHAMVPFYGQGMNSGFEDVNLLFKLHDQMKPYHDPSDSVGRRRATLQAYSDMRTPDAWAICDLALQNYKEMRSDVVNPLYKVRKVVEEGFMKYLPSLGWATQYSRVSFGTERFSVVERKAQRQGRVLLGALITGLGTGLGVVATLLYRWRGASKGVQGVGSWVADRFAALRR